MEYILAVLFTFKYIFGTSGNTDLLYLFSIIALLFYAWRRHDKFSLIMKTSIPLVIMCSGMVLFYPDIDAFRVLVFLGKMILNITFALFAAYNSRKWKIAKFLKVVILILAVETGLALLLPDSGLWITEKLIYGVEDVTRLKLFYLNAGALSFSCGFILILLVYQVITEEIVWHHVIGIVVVLIDIYLSYGIGGLISALLAVAVMLILAYIYRFKGVNKRSRKTFLWVSIISFASVLAVIITDSVYALRAKNVLEGTDYILNTKLLNPLKNIGNVLGKTNFLGVGFGNSNTDYAYSIMDVNYAYPNSFLRLVAEGGIFGIVIIALLIIGLLYVSFKYGKIIDKSLCIYVIVYQFAGGYFTDPTNFLIYGLIIGNCIKNEIEINGSAKLRLFNPVIKEKLKIAQIGHKRLYGREGGIEIVVEEISKRLVALGHEVDAYDRSGNHIAGEAYNAEKKNDGINIIKIPTIQRKGFAALVYSFLASIVVASKNYDVVHYHAEGPCAFIFIPSLFGIRTVATIHGIDWQRTGKWGSLASQFIKFGEKMAVEYADEIIVLSKQTQNYFLTTYNRKTHFIPNGVNKPELYEAEKITQRWGLNKDEYILSLARLTHEKGFHYLIEAFKSINTEKKLVIAGGLSDSYLYEKELKELAGDDDRIVFTGFVNGNELFELYSNAYIYCLASDLEGMPLSLLEAMSYGNCCLVSDIPECTSVIGKYGRSFFQGNVESLKTELTNLLDHPETVDEIRSKSSDYVCEKYRWDDVIERTLELYRI